MKFIFGLLASGLLTLGLAGAPAKVEAAPPQTAIHQAAAQAVQPVQSQLGWRRAWRNGWYGSSYPYYGSYYYSGPYYYYYAAPPPPYYYGGVVIIHRHW